MRSRILNPEFFKDEAVADLSMECRLAFAGLWCAADREGRFRWSPKRLKSDILPYDDIDFAILLTSLEDTGLIKSYDTKTNGKCGYIPNFLKYQKPHHREHASTIDGPCMDEARPNQVASCPPVSVSVSTSVSNSVCVYDKSKRLELTKRIHELLGNELKVKFVTRIWDWSDLDKLKIEDDWVVDVYRAVFNPDSPGWIRKDPSWLLGVNAALNLINHHHDYEQKRAWRSINSGETDTQVAERLIREQG